MSPKINNTSELISITSLAIDTSLSPRVLRHYVSIGLIESVKNSKMAVHMFVPSTIRTLQLVADLKNIGFSLDEIGIIIGKKLISNVDFKQKIKSPDITILINKINAIEESIKRIKKEIQC